MTTVVTREIDREVFVFKMRDLCERTGLDRQTIHFYIQQGLVPEGQKTGRNMAYYSEEHLERIRLVRELAHQRFLPLKAIRALLDGEEEAFSPEQRAIMSEVRTRVRSALRPTRATPFVSASAVAARTGCSVSEILELGEAGLLTSRGEAANEEVLEEDVWVVEAWVRLRAAGFDPALGFSPGDLAVYGEAMKSLVRLEARMFATRVGRLDPDEAGRLLDRGLPLINEFITRLHTSRARQLLATID